MAMLSLYGCTVCCLGVLYGCHVAEMTKAVRTLSAVRGPCVRAFVYRALWLACVGSVVCVRTGRGPLPAALSPGGALNSVPDVFVHSLFQSGKPCKQLGLHGFAPAVCCAALSVLVCRLCPAVVTHCLCRGTLGELEVMLMVP